MVCRFSTIWIKAHGILDNPDQSLSDFPKLVLFFTMLRG